MEGEIGRIRESTQTKTPKSLSARAKTATKRKIGKIKRMRGAKKRCQTIKKRGGGRKIKVSPRGRKENGAPRAKIPQASKIK